MRVRVIKTSNVIDKFMMKCFNTFFDKLELVDWEIHQNITQSFETADLITCGDNN